MLHIRKLLQSQKNKENVGPNCVLLLLHHIIPMSMASSASSPQSIRTVLKNLKTIKRIAFDIGQSVVKIAYTATVAKKKTTPDKKLIHDAKYALHLYCIQVRLEDFEAVLDYIAENGHIATNKATFASTSSTHHLEQMIVDKLGLEVHKVKEMDCLVRGTNFLIRNIEAESFTYDHHNEKCRYNFETIRPSVICPYLLVNVGTGVSVFRVDSDGRYERIGGSSLGGGCFFGLGNLLTSEVDLDEMMRMAEDGDHRQFDILVSDIYGGKFANLGLSGDLIAGSFGKCARKSLADELKNCPDFKKNVMRSLLLMISNSIGQFAFLYAQREKTNRIYFDGFLIRNHAIIMRTISFAIEFWSEGTQQAHFLRHEGYTSAIGAYLSGASLVDPADAEFGAGYEAERLSWHEYYSGCSDLGRFVPTAPLSMGFTFGHTTHKSSQVTAENFTIGWCTRTRMCRNYTEAVSSSGREHSAKLCTFSSCVITVVYKPDVADLNLDSEAREFWLKTFEKSVDSVIKKAVESQANCSSAEQRVQVFREKFLKQLMIIREKPFAYGISNVRNLLDLREQLLNEQDFDDSYLNQKTVENTIALKQLPLVLKSIDETATDSERLFRVSKGLLAGNVFDWGAQKVVEMMESSEGLSFDAAVSAIPERPWLVDSYDDFKNSVESKSYNCAAIFVDNSGADFILGVIPFARELIRRGSKVIIVSNLSPALNDLTYNEMIAMVPRIREADGFLRDAIDNEKLMFEHSGQGSPCLDLRKVHSVLNRRVLEEQVDFILIEGMGRALHTNLYAHFVCDSLKAAVIKTQWLADRMGGEIFSVVFKFERGKENGSPNTLKSVNLNAS
ncbi:hypothetical protein Y032_0024g1002 [Ancylostoma ceylanicum]|uniref:4'-phosphopantetheine phosphatase n=2 Tax=Ancylostoma ceylanicum TaxID=53326 RepID=A0A016UXT9_9BILA|nr:hypothetical protein Y032_0024g1002 [Ancylostoma ceylanicum]